MNSCFKISLGLLLGAVVFWGGSQFENPHRIAAGGTQPAQPTVVDPGFARPCSALAAASKPCPKRADLQQKVKDIIIDQLEINDAHKVTPTAKIREDLGADDLDFYGLVMRLENDFDVKISEEDFDKFVKVDDVVNYLMKQLCPSSQPATPPKQT